MRLKLNAIFVFSIIWMLQDSANAFDVKIITKNYNIPVSDTNPCSLGIGTSATVYSVVPLPDPEQEKTFHLRSKKETMTIPELFLTFCDPTPRKSIQCHGTTPIKLKEASTITVAAYTNPQNLKDIKCDFEVHPGEGAGAQKK